MFVICLDCEPLFRDKDRLFFLGRVAGEKQESLELFEDMRPRDLDRLLETHYSLKVTERLLVLCRS